MKQHIFAFLILSTIMAHAQNTGFKPAKVSYDDFKQLVSTVEAHRKERLIDLDTFLQWSKEENVVILDTRSDFRFERKHVKGAIHLAFTDFTQDNLRNLIPDENTKILIYCNNNFDDDQVDFATKIAIRKDMIVTQAPKQQAQFRPQEKPIMLALNIPTYINLYGYGYRNVYELSELVNVKDPRISFEGTVVK
jgi:hypothetical protein